MKPRCQIQDGIRGGMCRRRAGLKEYRMKVSDGFGLRWHWAAVTICEKHRSELCHIDL